MGKAQRLSIQFLKMKRLLIREASSSMFLQPFEKVLNMSKIVPLISSGTAGPLGVLHLPRMWQKVSLEAAGKIADVYPGIGAGYDSMVVDALGLSADAVRSFIADSKPTYPQLEAWIKEQPGVKLDDDTISALNASITGYIHDDATRQ